MSRSQRFALLGLAAIVAVVAIVVLPGSDDETRPAAPATQAGEPASSRTTQAPEAQAAPEAPLLRAGTERELEFEFEKGDTVRFRVRHPEQDDVHVHGYDISRNVEPGKTLTMPFEANLEGIFEIGLERTGTPIATLKVEPQ